MTDTTDSSSLLSSVAQTWNADTCFALQFDVHKRMTCQECSRAVARYGSALKRLGATPGSRIMLRGAPSPQYIMAFWAALRCGAVVCPVNPAWPVSGIKTVVDLLKPAGFLYAGENAGEGLNTPCWPMEVLEGESLEAATSSAFAAENNPLSLDRPTTVVMTSGSMGAPKAVVHSMFNHISSARAAVKALRMVTGDRWLLTLPLFHVSGISVLFRCAWAGAEVALPDAGSSLEDSIRVVQPTHLSLAPTQLYRLLESGRAVPALRDMKAVLLGGAPLDPALAKRALQLGVPLVCSYGMTETSAMICATPPGATFDQGVTGGRPLHPESMRIAEGNHIDVRGPFLFLGYWQSEGGWRRPETPDGWFRTGDLGYWNKEGGLLVTGRADAMFISGGENMYPEEIESVLCAYPGVRHAAVAAVPDAEFGAIPVAFVETDAAGDWKEEAWRCALAAQLPKFKIPKHFFPWPVGVDSNMKMDRARLQQIAVQMRSAPKNR